MTGKATICFGCFVLCTVISCTISAPPVRVQGTYYIVKISSIIHDYFKAKWFFAYCTNTVYITEIWGKFIRGQRLKLVGSDTLNVLLAIKQFFIFRWTVTPDNYFILLNKERLPVISAGSHLFSIFFGKTVSFRFDHLKVRVFSSHLGECNLHYQAGLLINSRQLQFTWW